MNFFHLFSLALMAALNFSAKSLAPATITAPVISSVNPIETEEYISWTADRLLSWDDFKCEPKKGTDAVASTSTTLGIAYQLVDGHLSYDITCNFSKVKSWGLMKTDYILAHEQGHFDITEIYARKLHQELQNYQFNRKSFKKDISEIYQRIVKEKEAHQKKYDGETDHSRNRKQQYEWLNRIQTLLDETQDHSIYP